MGGLGCGRYPPEFPGGRDFGRSPEHDAGMGRQWEDFRAALLYGSGGCRQ